MTVHRYITVLALCATPILAQTAASLIHTSEIGFSYSLPADWEVVDTKPTLPAVKQEAAKTAKSEGEKKGISCVEAALTARHGDPASVVVAVTLPFDCYGQTMSDADLPDFGAGVSQGLTNTFNVENPVRGAYSLGSHKLWIERATGVPKGHPEAKYTLETVCSILKKGAVCWMSMSANDAALHTFEGGAVTLDGEASAALVSADAFAKKP